MKKKAEKAKVVGDGNGQDNDLKAMFQTIITNQKEQEERLKELEEDKAKNVTGEALLQMVNFLYNTDDKHMPELTRIPIQAARPLSYAIGLGGLLDAREKGDTTSLSQRIQLNYFRLMRSVGGVHLGRGIRLAEEQAAAEAEKAEEFELGGET